MNNVKVRIYELSKELNLENKDILAVCERLNIAVKSHSSTITESDAQRIEKYVATHPIVSPHDSHSDRGSGPSKHSAQPDLKKKQEILEIRKPKIQANQQLVKPQTANTDSASMTVATQPQPPVSPQSSKKPTQLNQPVPTPPNSTPPSPAKPAPEQADSQIQTAAQSDVVTPTPNLQAPTPSSDVESLQLVSPPVRPQAPTSRSAPLRNKPVLKQSSKPEPAQPVETQPTSSTPSPRPVTKPIKNKSRPAPAPAKPSEAPEPREREIKKVRKEIVGPKAKPVPALQPPPSRKDLELATDQSDPSQLDSSEEEVGVVEDVVEELKRPKKSLVGPKKSIPSRIGKRSGSWEEEEEDPADLENKNAKAAKTKAKRPRIKPLDEDDDDDFENGLNSGSDGNSSMSLSLARPPKPKNMAGQRPAATTATTARPKRPTSNRGSNSSSANTASKSGATTPKQQRPEKLVIAGSMTVQELAMTLMVPETEIIKRLFSQGIAVNITETLDYNIIEAVCQEFEVELETAEQKSGAEKSDNILTEEDLEHLQLRPPVVTIMGHVDHGKTTLLDSIRETKVAQGEAGGITQHIGAYHVDVEHEGKMQQVVFLDTPGHEAFTAMRARGTRVTDIAILVVAADDGVRPQTIEAISHAKAAGVPIIVAINKIDKESAQPDRVKQELMEHGLVPEEWGGDAIMVPVSAIQGENLDLLLEMILLVAEVADLEANPDRAAKGTVIESHLDKARGPVASLLVQNGTLRVGDIVVAGAALGKVRAMIDDRGDRVEAASPSFAVEILGLRDVPAAGDEFDVFESEREAAALAESRAQAQRQSRILQGRVSLSALSARAQEGELKELNIILKTDVQGSVEAIVNALKKLPQKEVQLRLLLAAPGEVTETDIDLASASDAVLIGFNTTLANGARQAADEVGIDIREYNIIYNLLDDVQAAMEGLLEPELVEESLGQAEVRAVFPVGRNKVAGCYIQSGKVVRNCKVRVHRKGQVIYTGVLDSLKRMKDDAKEVNAGYECGMGADNFNDWIEGDIIEAYRMATKRRTLSV